MPACPLCDSEASSVSPILGPVFDVTCPTCSNYKISTALVLELKTGPQWNEVRAQLSKAVSWAAQRQKLVSLETVRDVSNLNAAFGRSERKRVHEF